MNKKEELRKKVLGRLKKSTKLLLLTTIITAIMILSSCGANYTCSDGTTVSSPDQCPEIKALNDLAKNAAQNAEEMNNKINDMTDKLKEMQESATNTNTETTQNQETETNEEVSRDEAGNTIADDERAAEILAIHKTKNIKSYQFLYAPLPENIGKNFYKVYGDKVLVEPKRDQTFNPETWSDHIYLDLSTKSAKGFCLSNQISICPEQGAERSVNFDDWVIKMPLDWLKEPGLKNAYYFGDRLFENQDCYIIRFEQDGKYYEYFISKFWGVPIRVGIYSDPDFTQTIGGAEYRDISINTVKASDVEPPQ